MIDAHTVEKEIERVREELDMPTLTPPRIVDVLLDREGSLLHVIAEDRPDKAAALGMGGIVLHTVASSLGFRKAFVTSRQEIEVKRSRIVSSLRALRELGRTPAPRVKRVIESRLIPLLENELKYPHSEMLEMDPLDEADVVVAFSGGVDSTAMLVAATKVGLKPTAVSVSPGSWMIPPETVKVMERVTSRLGVKNVFLEGHGYEAVLGLASKGLVHPCGRCHCLTERVISSWALHNGFSVVCFGDLLPTGSHAVYSSGGILRFNLAALAMSKRETNEIAKMHGHPGAHFYFGCPLLRSAQRKHRHLQYLSVYRVLRECHSGILEPAQALRYIKSIIG